MSQHITARSNMVAKGAQRDVPNNVAICCIKNVVIVWPELQMSLKIIDISVRLAVHMQFNCWLKALLLTVHLGLEHLGMSPSMIVCCV